MVNFPAPMCEKSLLSPRVPDESACARLLEVHTHILEITLSEGDSKIKAERICQLAESLLPQSVATVLLLDSQGKLKVFAAPSVPPEGQALLNGLELGLQVGSCGSAVRSTQPVFVTDTLKDACWLNLLPLVERFHIMACWSQPIIDREGRVLGSFALASFTRRTSSDFHHTLLRTVAAALAFILEQAKNLARLALQNHFLEQTSDGIAILDREGRVRYTNQAFTTLLGIPAQESLTGKLCPILQGHHISQATAQRLRSIYELGQTATLELSLAATHPPGRWVEWHVEPTLQQNRIHQRLVTLKDITTRKIAELGLQRRQKLYQALLMEDDILLEAGNEWEMLIKTCRKLAHNTIFHTIWIGQPNADGSFRLLASAGTGSRVLARIQPTVNEHALISRAFHSGKPAYHNDNIAAAAHTPWETFIKRFRWRAALAAPIRRQGQVWAAMVFVAMEKNVFDQETRQLCRRITELLGHGLNELDLKQSLAALQRQEARLARQDALTGLPNRFALEEHLKGVVTSAARHNTRFAVGFIDLDDFKPVNDRWGHAAGDMLLVELAQRLHNRVRATDFLARLGGDEFVVVFEDLDTSQWNAQLRIALDRLHQAMETPFEVGKDHKAEIRLSMGIAIYPLDGGDPDTLLRQADAALYQTKQHKSDRSHWWRLGTTAIPLSTPGPELDPCGPEARTLLTHHQDLFAAIATHFVHDFYASLDRNPQASAILTVLNDTERARLEQRQADYLCFLTDPGTDAERLRIRAREIGEAHALIGVTGGLLIKAHQLHQTLLSKHLHQTTLHADMRYRLFSIVASRFADDLKTELDMIDIIEQRFLGELAEPLPDAGICWADLVQAELDRLAALPGIRTAILLRPNTQGVFIVETAGAGLIGVFIADILRQPSLRPVLDPDHPLGQSMASHSWRKLHIQSVANFSRHPGYAPWREVAQKTGIRAALAIPLRDSQKNGAAVLVFYGAWPNQFESRFFRQWAESLQQRWEIFWRQSHSLTPVVARIDAEHWRTRLFTGGLRLYLQPIVDLTTGSVVKVEALARLALEDDTLVVPGQFLALLGESELYRLFQHMLAEALDWLTDARTALPQLTVSVNLPPSCLLEADLGAHLQTVLEQRNLAPNVLVLELLETEAITQSVQHAAIHTLKILGVQLALDDLGSGYSSLLRLIREPLDILKIDQNLVRRLPEDPLPTLTLLWTLLNLGCNLEREVVVEGLETPALIEVMQQLGAPQGQGYALARPMPAADFLAWAHGFQLTQTPAQIQSFAGALAYHWRWRHGDHASTQICPLIAFLRERGPENVEPELWYHRAHAGGYEWERNADNLLVWLANEARTENG